jgi:Trk K+ transport system NAD-binding subunit
LVVARLTVNPDSKLIGKAIREIGGEMHVFFLSHTRRDAETRFPTGNVELAAGDQVVVQTEPATLKRLHEVNMDQRPY